MWTTHSTPPRHSDAMGNGWTNIVSTMPAACNHNPATESFLYTTAQAMVVVAVVAMATV